ncbi:MAG: DegT/DnrJ/EryC1/StrS family aminotransferase [Terriglobales bacterium]
MPQLALHGGTRAVPATEARTFWPIVTAGDKQAVAAVLERNILWAMTKLEGLDCPEQDALEREFAAFLGAKHALAVNGGTAGLHMALVASGVQAGDEVITSAYSFLATPAAILHAAAIPVFVDIDPRTWNLDPALIEAKITPRTKAILPVDIHGLCADYDSILAIARRHNLWVVEDACQAPGATYQGRAAGRLGRAAGFSVNGTKNFSVGEGGFMVTDDEEVYYRGSWLKQVGETLPAANPTMRHQHLLAWNYRVQEMPCALARSQLRRLAAVNERARRNAAILDGYLRDIPGFRAPYIPPGCVPVYHKYRLALEPELLDTPLRGQPLRDAIMAALTAEGVDVDLWGTAPLAAHPMIRGRHGFGRGYPWSLHPEADYSDRPENYPVTQRMFAESFCLTNDEHPIFAQSESLMHSYGEALRKVAHGAGELRAAAAWQTAT